MAEVKQSIMAERFAVYDTRDKYNVAYSDFSDDPYWKFHYEWVRNACDQWNSMDKNKARFIPISIGHTEVCGTWQQLREHFMDYGIPIMSRAKAKSQRIEVDGERMTIANALVLKAIQGDWDNTYRTKLGIRMSYDENVRHWQSMNWSKTNGFKPITTPAKRKKDTDYVAHEKAIDNLTLGLTPDQVTMKIRFFIEQYRHCDAIGYHVFKKMRPIVPRTYKDKGRKTERCISGGNRYLKNLISQQIKTIIG